MLKFDHKMRTQGFTLVETLVSVVILITIVVGPMTIAAKGMQTGYYSNEQTTAVYLAQEAIEWTRTLRDDVALVEFEEYIASGPGTGISGTWDWYDDPALAPCKTPNSCDIDFPGTIKNCNGGSSCNLKMDTGALDSLGTRVYGYDSNWDSSMYTRKIVFGTPITSGVDDIAVPVTVTVTWNSNLLGPKSVVLQTYIYDRYKFYE